MDDSPSAPIRKSFVILRRAFAVTGTKTGLELFIEDRDEPESVMPVPFPEFQRNGRLLGSEPDFFSVGATAADLRDGGTEPVVRE